MTPTSAPNAVEPIPAELPVEAQPATQGDVLAEIRRDCQDEPKRYLDEVEVPFGGE